MKNMYIGGRWLAARDGATLPVVAPADGAVYEHIAAGGAHEVDLAVRAARAALAGPWGRMTPTERGRLLVRIGQAVLEQHEALAQLEARDTGKPLTTARNDITVLARYFEFYGTAADKVHGETIPFLAGHQVSLLREPLGVTAHIIPWNYPAQMLGRTVAPALAMGNATVLKPAEDTSLSALRVAEIATACGLPEGVLNVVTGTGEAAGAALAAHPGIDFISFTGSNEVGTLVQAAAAKNAVKCVLELGGKSPQIVFEDVDVERAVPIIVRAIVQNAGQTCTAGSRLLVQRSIWPSFVERVAAAFSQVRVGTPEMDLDCGPVMNPAQLARVQRYIDQAIAGGVPVLARGSLAEGTPATGYYVTPTLFGPVPRTHALACEEVFGPVLAALPFEDEADAIALANDTPYGLSGSIWTDNLSRAVRVSRAVESGNLSVNSHSSVRYTTPFGGFKQSGLGRELGPDAPLHFTETKNVFFAITEVS